MDPASCRVVYVDDRFPAEKWLTRDTISSSTTNDRISEALSLDLAELPLDLQANVNAILGVFNQVFVCRSGRSFSARLAETQEAVKLDCTPILALFDVGPDSNHDHILRLVGQRSKSLSPGPPSPSRASLQRQLTFSSEADESYGLQLLSRIASDLQVDEGVKLIIPVALVRARQKSPTEATFTPSSSSHSNRDSPTSSASEDKSSPIDPHMMLKCLDAGALDVVASPLNSEKTLGLTVHAYRIYKTAKKEQSEFFASASKLIAQAPRRKQSWVGVEDEKPYAYLREAMVKKLLKGICEPETFIEDYQHRDLHVEGHRRDDIVHAVSKWNFSPHDFSEDELVYAGYYMLDHALKMPELENWRMSQDEILRFMQASRVGYNSFVQYHNFRHAVDVLQSLFYFLVQIGTIPPYPVGSAPPPLSQDKSPIAQLLSPFEALTLLISAIGHDVGHPGVNNMFLIKLKAPLAQLYNDQSVLESFHCAAYSQILRRHWPSAFADESLRRLLISSVLATDMGIHNGYIRQLSKLQEKIHESQTTDGWDPEELDTCRILICGLLIKCADISNAARPMVIGDRWVNLLHQEFASQGDMENQVGMETVLYGGPPDVGNTLKQATGQISFIGLFAHPLFAKVADIIPAMGFAVREIINNKGVCMTRTEQEKRKEQLNDEGTFTDGAVSPRSQSPASSQPDKLHTTHPQSTGYLLHPSLRYISNPPLPLSPGSSILSTPHLAKTDDTAREQSEAPTWQSPFVQIEPAVTSSITSTPREATRASSGVFPDAMPKLEARRPEIQTRKSSNTVPCSLPINRSSVAPDERTTATRASNEAGDYDSRRETEPRESDFAIASMPLMCDRSVLHPPDEPRISEEESTNEERRRPVSESCLAPVRHFSRAQNPIRNSSHMSIPSSADRNSRAASGGRAYSTNLSTTLSPSTEATSFLSVESSDDQVDDSSNSPSDPRTSQDLSLDGARSRSSVFPEVVPPHSIGRIPAAESNGEGSRKSPMKTSTAVVSEPGQETVSAWEGDGEKTMSRKMSRLRFWRKKMEEDER